MNYTDIDLLLVLSDKDTYYKYSNMISKYLDKESELIVSAIDQWFTADPTRIVVDWAGLATWFKLVHQPGLKDEKQEFYQEVFNRLNNKPRDPTLAQQVVTSIVGRGYASAIANDAMLIAEGASSKDMDSLKSLMEEYEKEVGVVSKIDSYIVTEEIDQLFESVVGGHGYEWRLKELNEGLGPLRKGDFIVIGARPDAGKTTMLASECTFMAQQMAADQHVVWFNNEEEGKKVKWRVIQSALGWTNAQMSHDLKATREEYEKLMGRMDKIIIVDKKSPALHANDIRPILDRYNPGLVIFDQLRKVHGFQKEANEVMRLQHLFQLGREIAKEYAPVLNVHQARGDAEGSKWPEMNQLHNSQTDIQGEADAIMMIGKSHEVGFEKSRFLYLPKNKLAGGPLSDPTKRNGKFEVLIKPEIARFESP